MYLNNLLIHYTSICIDYCKYVRKRYLYVFIKGGLGGRSTQALIGDYTQSFQQKQTPLRTPVQENIIMQEARNQRAFRDMDPLAGILYFHGWNALVIWFLGCSAISVSFAICLLTLLLMPLADLHFCMYMQMNVNKCLYIFVI
jgi:hypothetical protein